MVWLDSILRRGVLPLVLLTASMLRYNVISLLYLLLLMVCLVLPRPVLRLHKCASITCFVLLLCVSLIGTLGQPLFQFTLLSNSTYQLPYCSAHESLWRQFGFIQFIRPNSEPVPTIDIIRHYLPDVVVFIFTMVTIVATFVVSSKIKICTREGNRAEHNGEDVTAARNEARPEVAHGASHDAHSHRPEAASHDTQRLEAPDTDNSNDLDLRMTNITTRHDGDHWQMPPFVVRCLDLAIFVMLGACGVTVPSLTSSLYFAIFLVKATLWAVHLEWWNRRLSVRLLLLVYTGCHLLVVYLYQFEVAKKLIPLQPANTATSMVARLFGLTAVVCINCTRPTELEECPDVPVNYIISPIFLFILFWLVATELTLRLPSPGSFWQLNHTYHVLQEVEAHHVELEHTSVNLGSEQESTHPTQNVISDDEPCSDVSSVPLSLHPYIVQVKRKGKSLYGSMMGKVTTLWGALMRVNFVFSIVAMMLWGIFNPCWLSVVLLLWACVIWIIPRINPRDSLYYTSPVLVVYAIGLLCLQYVYSLDGTDLGSNGSFVVIKSSVAGKSVYLAMEAAFVLLFLTSLHEFVTTLKKKRSQRPSFMSQYGSISLIPTVETIPTDKAIDFSSHLYSTVFQLLSAYWIVVVFGVFLLAIMAGEPGWLKVVYIIVFYISLLMHQMFKSFWRHLVTPLWCVTVLYAMLHLLVVYTAQFEIIQTVWAEAFNSTGANANDVFQTIGILTYTPGNTRSLFETLVPLAIFIAVLAIQLRYFMFQKVQMTNAANSSLIMLDYFKPCSEANPSTVTAHDWPDTHVVGGKREGRGGEERGGRGGEGGGGGGGGGGGEGGGGGGGGGEGGGGENSLFGSQSFVSSTLGCQSTSTSQVTSEKVYLIMWSLAMCLRQLTVSIIYLAWRFLALHTHKVAMLTLFIVSLSQVSAAYLVLLLMAVLATPLPMVHRVMYPVITFYLGLIATVKMVYQAPLLGTQYLNLTTFCNTSGVSSNITGMVFNDQYSPVGSDPSWFGLHKVTAGSSFASYIAGPILAALVLSLWISAQRYQDHYYTTENISLGPYDKGSLFLGVSRDDADQSLINASKFLLNHFFKMYGLETCCSMLAIAVAVRIDIYGIFYAMVLGLLMLVPRPPSKVHLVLWTFYLVLHGLLLVVQYAFLLGVPKGVCLYPGTERDYPWSNMTSPEKKWLFLSQSNQQILDKNLLYADILIYLLLCFQLHHVYTTTTAAGGATNEREGEKDKAQPRIFGLAIWSDCAKILIFKYSFWLTLLLLFLFATLQISLFGWIYLLACFFFLFRGQTILKATRSHRIRWWSALRFLVWLMLLIRVALQIVDCAFTEKASLLYRVLLSGNCNNPIYYGSSQHNDDASNLGLWTDSASFILLSLQIIIMDTKYAEAVKAELIKQDANSTSFAAILKQRISENQKKSIHQRNEELSKLNDRMNKLSEQLNTIEHVLHAQVKIPSHITRRYGRKSLPKALLEAHGIQGVSPPSPTLQSNHLKGHTTNEDEPSSKNEDQDEPIEPWYRNVATFLGSSVEMLIGWLNTNSEDYRYVVERVRRRERDGVGEGAGPSPKAAEPLHSWGDDRTLKEKIIQQGGVIVEALHLEPSTEDKKEARAVERELIGEAELHVNKFQQLLAALYYCFLAHSEVLVYFLIIFNVLLNGSVLSLGFAFLMFSWGLLSYPWPTKKFWIILTFYTMFVILIRYAFQFSNADTENCDEEDLDKGRCPTQIVGIHYHRKKFYTYVVWDFILLMAVFVHTGLLKEYGLWNQIVNERRNPLAQLLEDFKAFFTHLISSDSSRGARGGRDYYTIMLFFDLLVFVTIVFGASSFGISTVEGDVQVISLITSNSFPMGFVVFLLLQFISMLVDRAIYLRRSIIAKFAFQVFLLLVWHVWLFFVLPAITAQAVWKNIPAWFIYLFKCSYFIISSLQITLDYPVQYVGWFLRDTYNIVSSQLLTVYKNIPLLPELREMIDWVFTDTVLNLFQWLTVQKVWFLIYQVKNRREQEKREIRILGTPPSLLVKILYGTVLVLLFLCLIWGPLFFFSLVTETGSLNPVTSMSIEVSLEGFQPLLTARQLDISNMTDSEYNQLVDKYKNNTPQFASIFSKDNFQKVLISNQPASVWIISPPAREQLVAKVQARFQSGGSLNLLSSWTISRTPISTAAQIHLSGQRSIVLSNNTLQELYCSLNHTDQSCSRISTVTVKDLFPYYIRAPNTGESKGILEEYVSCIFSLSSSNSSGSPEWWTLEEVNGTDPAGIELLVFSDRVAPGIFGSFASIGIIALYGTYVLAFGKIIHSYAEGLIFSLIFNEIMCPDVLWQLLEDIYLVRSRRKFDLEEILVGRLFAVIRSPESIIQLTEVEKPKRD